MPANPRRVNKALRDKKLARRRILDRAPRAYFWDMQTRRIASLSSKSKLAKNKSERFIKLSDAALHGILQGTIKPPVR